ncbi:GNAT family N-acetyltransferase [Stackebrandtia nassauensis]|uniref:GCN5-related N-acetyltransferase n=1 Tax=Stackebrandtia nassauensis (strain DSM 44728 / CIP 108903 / NRRL B-16338 / NBRC 102104 / LLR-40K-21) TaxID=446470 RepID=D3QBJ8_STANL|nr:GNAT family N-acetyltransferase [Stackebrandtia nassauensis]ADD42880.1 GCN5-related N-acetyltransferase [Stackebrandtia nassauensis DSM 44728]
MAASLAPVVPAGYRARPSQPDDVAAITALVAACEVDLFGRVESDAGHAHAVFARDGLDAGRDTVLVFGPGGEVVAWAWVNRRSEVYVHPAHRGRGLGSGLLAWIQRRARQAGTVTVAQQVPDSDTAAARLLGSAGFVVKARAWMLGIDTAGVTVAEVDGIAFRGYRTGDLRAAWQVTEDAFGDWKARRTPLREWAAGTVEQSAFAPGASAMAFDGDELVGALIALDVLGRGEGYVEYLAVASAYRGRGIARGLLRFCFAAFAEAGYGHCTLWTHTDTGALSLYERVGMSVERTASVYFKELGDNA